MTSGSSAARPRKRSNRHKLTREQRSMIPRLHARGIGTLAISRALGVSRQTVRMHVRRAQAR